MDFPQRLFFFFFSHQAASLFFRKRVTSRRCWSPEPFTPSSRCVSGTQRHKCCFGDFKPLKCFQAGSCKISFKGGRRGSYFFVSVWGAVTSPNKPKMMCFYTIYSFKSRLSFCFNAVPHNGPFTECSSA